MRRRVPCGGSLITVTCSAKIYAASISVPEDYELCVLGNKHVMVFSFHDAGRESSSLVFSCTGKHIAG